MRPTIHLILLILLGRLIVSAQPSRFIYYGQLKASATQEQLRQAFSLHDLSPDFWSQLTLPSEMKQEFDKKRLTASAQGYYVYPADRNYSKYIKISEADIELTCEGKIEKLHLEDEKINNELRHLLKQADLGTDIIIKVTFPAPVLENKDTLLMNITKATVAIHVVPDKEAEYPGGLREFTRYIADHIFMEFPGGNEAIQVSRARVSFSIDETGAASNVRMATSSGNPKIDVHIIRVFRNMPTWKPALNDGKKIKQDFTVPFRGDGC